MNNISEFKYKALLKLSKNRDIVIKKADKGSITVTVIMDCSTYLQALPTRAQAYKREGDIVGEGLLSN